MRIILLPLTILTGMFQLLHTLAQQHQLHAIYTTQPIPMVIVLSMLVQHFAEFTMDKHLLIMPSLDVLTVLAHLTIYMMARNVFFNSLKHHQPQRIKTGQTLKPLSTINASYPT